MDYSALAIEIRKKMLSMHAKADVSHIGSAFSCLDLIVALYYEILNIDPENPDDPTRDRFILSKGHAASALYTTLAYRGFFAKEILDTYCLEGGTLPGHTTKGCVPGIEVSAGSLGHGLAIGNGLALAAKRDAASYRTFVLVSDGECDEGSLWEAALLASHHKLDNLSVIVDYNKIQSFGNTNEVLNLEPLKDKWQSFGWAVEEVNGHDYDQVIQTFKKIPFVSNRPSVVLAHTVKGKGVSFMEHKLEWHYRSPNQDQLATAIKELDMTS